MGRDQHVVVETRGFLYPFGHKATLIKQTDRQIERLPSHVDAPDEAGKAPAFVAYLRQIFYIVVKEPVKQLYNWDTCFPTLDFEELRSPILDQIQQIPKRGADGTPIPGSAVDFAFWPTVRGERYRFRLKGTDHAGSPIHFKAPVIFVEDRDGMFCATTANSLRSGADRGGQEQAARLYSDHPQRRASGRTSGISRSKGQGGLRGVPTLPAGRPEGGPGSFPAQRRYGDPGRRGGIRRLS